MTIKEYLENIGLPFENEETALEFISHDKIKEFICERYSYERKLDVDFLQKDVVTIINEEIMIVNENSLQPSNNDIDRKEDSLITTETMKYSDLNNPMDELAKQHAKDQAFENHIRSQSFCLQNGKVNQPYSFTIDSEFISKNQIGDFYFDGLDEIGIRLNKETNTIEGIPTIAGDHKITWFFKSKNPSIGNPVFSKELTLVVNPDPRSLWNNIPTPPDTLFYKADSDKAYLKVESQRGFFGLGKKEQKDMVAASQRGRAHAHEGRARDDDFKFLFDIENDWYMITVADGAGSAKYSRRGSQIACKTVIDICQEKLQADSDKLGQLIKNFNKSSSDESRKAVGDLIYEILGTAIFKAYKNIGEEAVKTDGNIRDFSTTLLLSICKKYNFGWFVASFWIGDGGIGIYNKDTQFLKVLGEPDGGEFAGQTRFLTMSEIMQPAEIYRRLRFEIVDDFTALVLMTDGITDPKFETESNLMQTEKWNNLWDDLNREVEFKDDFDCSDQLLKWLDFWSPGNHDDRTIAIIY
ncbi:protein phosphatase 2C domain-containing protein [Dysgonomonas sp. Marseille-P4677]|uniref:PP2C family serine/threonine-protein phosphatase n=1 Tax=Dysgonomonas sp. Marseille-P4677 TaxID=2364790 RepID=UPI0019139090|nr:PP2C family serine/threonine-protein phosphatase [Dysgonomonas sp. Marseille-P4677]MBK5720882.1 protein phosphatase 2C domain-containing protein [Dysgonomonas sp. Marseille-P4677]